MFMFYDEIGPQEHCFIAHFYRLALNSVFRIAKHYPKMVEALCSSYFHFGAHFAKLPDLIVNLAYHT